MKYLKQALQIKMIHCKPKGCMTSENIVIQTIVKHCNHIYHKIPKQCISNQKPGQKNHIYNEILK